MTSDRSGLVVKEVTSRRDLADYLTSFTAGEVSYHAMLAHYLGEEGHGRAEVFQALNCASEWKPALLVEFRREQQRKARRGRGRSVYHFVISRRGRTDPKILAAMANRFLVLVGLDKQKALIAVHCDTDDNHVHIAVSALDKQGRQIILERGYSKILLAHVNAQLCFEFGYDPEAGLGFHATGDGVYRSEDGARLRDDTFRKVTNDLRKQPALTAPSAASERETGLPSVQRQIREAVEQAMREPTLEEFSVTLAVAGITYALEGSGATISLADETFKASRIARDATPKRIAAHFGVTHLTTPEAGRLGLATGAGFYRRNDVGVLQPVRLAKTQQVNRDPALPMPGADMQYRQHLAEKRLERAIPQPMLTHTDPVRDRIEMLRARPAPFRRWQAERLERALHYCTGRRGRPKRVKSVAIDAKMPQVELRDDTAIILGPRGQSRWDGVPIWSDVRVKKAGPLWHATRGSTPVATFGPGMIIVHRANDSDRREIMKWAKLNFAEDVAAYCRPKDRAAWIKAAETNDLVLSNDELVKAQEGLLQTKQLKFDRIAGQLAAMGETLLTSGIEALGSAVSALKNAAPVLDRTYAQGRQRARSLSDRLSVQHARIDTPKVLEQAKAELMNAQVSLPPKENPQQRPEPARAYLPQSASLPLEAVTSTTRPSCVSAAHRQQESRDRQPTEWTEEIAEDGTLRLVFPGIEPAGEHRTTNVHHFQDNPPFGANREISASPTQATSDKTPCIAPTPQSVADTKIGAHPSESGRATFDARQPAAEISPSNVSRAIGVEEAIGLVNRLDAVPCLQANRFSIRIFGTGDWQSISISTEGLQAAAAARSNFIRRVNAVENACLNGEIVLGPNGLTAIERLTDNRITADVRRLIDDEQAAALMHDAVKRAASNSSNETDPAVNSQIAHNAKSPRELTSAALQAALEAMGRNEAKIASSQATASSASDVSGNPHVSQIKSEMSMRQISDITLLVAQEAVKHREDARNRTQNFEMFEAEDRPIEKSAIKIRKDSHIAYGVVQNGREF